MLFFKARDPDSESARRNLPFRVALLPDFGRSVRPIGESARIFVKLVGTLFAMNGLFPKDHPAFAEGSTATLTIGEIIATSWRNLIFDEKHLPQLLFFFAAVGWMAIAALALGIGLFSIFIGTAHAQSSAFFTPPSGDLAQNWIDYLFQGTPLATTYNQDGSQVQTITQTGDINIQCSMMTMLGFYSDAVLMVAALILFYHLASMVVETAHHGTVMGKRANQVWAPIRLVVAVGLLVPIGNNGPANCSATSGAGLNSAQYITIKIAELGSALASNAWQKFINAMNGAQYNFVPPAPPEVDRIVSDIFLMEGCMAAWNYEVNQVVPQTPGVGAVELIQTPTQIQVDGGIRYNYGTTVINEEDVCGHIFIPKAPQASTSDSNNDPLVSQVPLRTQVSDAIYQAHVDTIQTMIPIIRGYVGQGAQPDISYFIPDWNGKNGDNAPPDNHDFQNAVSQYYSTLKGNLASAYAGVSASLQQTALTSIGWIGAGAWLNTVSRDQAALFNATYDGTPFTRQPVMSEQNSSTMLSDTVINALHQFEQWMITGFQPTAAAFISPCDAANAATSGNAGKRTDDGDSAEPLRMILDYLDGKAVEAGLWAPDEQYACPGGTPVFTLGTQFTSNNPLGELTAYGHRAIHLGLRSINDMLLAMGLQAVGGALQSISKGLADPSAEDGDRKEAFKRLADDMGQAAQGGGAAAAAIFGFFAFLFLTIGVTLGFILPLIPFMHFFFASVAWGLVLLEAIVAMPLVALAHLNPEGDGLPGGMAKQAYFMLLGLFMRPVLIVFGLIVSLLIFMMAMFLLNKLFAVTVVGTGGMAQGYATVTRMVYTFIYVFLAYTCAINCFKVVDQLPEAVFRWISINIQHQRIADGGSTLQTAGTIATGVVTQQGVSALQGAGSGATQLASGGGKALFDAFSAAKGPAKNPGGQTKR